MATENRKNTLLTALVCVLIVVVAVLAYMVFQMNSQMGALVAKNESMTAGSINSEEGDVAKAGTTGPNVGHNDPWDVFSTPFDPDHWDPFSEMDEIHRRIDAMFNDAFGRFGRTPRFSGLLKGSTFTPRMDLVDKGDRYVIRLDVPGAKNSEIDVSLHDQTLTVEATSKFEDEQKEKNYVLRRERRMGRFRRQITLPEPVDAGSLETNYEDGVLTITIRKTS